MKTNSLLFFALIWSAVLFVTSCSNEESEMIPTETAKASVSVKITGEELQTRATTPASPEENAIKSTTLYVFYESGVLEASGTTLSMSDLTTGKKVIAAVVNAPDGFPASTITNYDDFQDELFDLDTQTTSTIGTDGLVMSGAITPTLTAGSNTLTIPVSRVVAKVQLGTVTISPATGHEASKFTLTAVHIMKAKSMATAGLPTVTTSGDLYGGFDDSSSSLTIASEYKPYLTGDAASGSNSTYFYVFPNGSTDATLMTLEGTYDGKQTFFPFIINDGTGNTGDGSGEYIKRNTFHKVNVTLKKLGGGSENPETLVDESTITVTIQTQDWETVPEQSVEW